MALINCPKCKKKISDKEKACPHCGFRLGEVIDEKLSTKVVESKDPSRLSNITSREIPIDQNEAETMEETEIEEDTTPPHAYEYPSSEV